MKQKRNKKENRKPGPKEVNLSIEGEWGRAVGRALQKPKPKATKRPK